MLKLLIKERREEKGISTRQLSELTGIRWNTVKDMEENTSKHWSPDNLGKIMVALGLNQVTDLIEWVGTPKDKKEQAGR